MLRDPPHYLKQLKSSTTPKRLLWLACSGSNTKQRGQYVRVFQSAALGATWWTEKAKQRKDSLDVYGDPAELWKAVAKRCPVGRRVVLFAYDLAEQMRLSQMLTQLPKLGWTLDRISMDGVSVWCLLRNGKRSLMCCDLRAWTPVTWGTIVADVGWNTEVATLIDAGRGYHSDRCSQRVEILRAAVLQVLNWIEGEALGPFRPTGAGQSYSAYRRRFLSHRLLVHDDERRLHAEREAMATGRAEAWRHGLLLKGTYCEYDLHAAYASIGAACDVPSMARGELRNPSPAKVARLLDRYAILAEVTVTTEIECLPCTVGGRTIWPVGTFKTTLWDPELRLALDHADKVTVHKAWLYQKDPAIRDFCNYVLDGMGPQTQVYGMVPKRVLKHWSRCLVGRLGLRYRAWHKFGEQSPPDVRLVTYMDIDEGTKTDLLLAGNQRMILGDMTESPESLPQIPGWVMSKCRALLWQHMTALGLDRVVYVDTDSVIYRTQSVPPDELYSDPEHWARWSHKGTYKTMTVYGPRNLTVGVDRRVSGLPLSAIQEEPMVFKGEVVQSIKESIRRGDTDRVVTLPRTFHLKATDRRRQHNLDTTTSPFRIEQRELDASHND